MSSRKSGSSDKERTKRGAEPENGSEPKFEEAMAALEEVVRQLEAGDVPLEESLAAFEKGVGLVRILHARLDAVQEKIEELTRSEAGKLELEVLDEE
jgi:exodeoxyribonuclease VII small subunit